MKNDASRRSFLAAGLAAPAAALTPAPQTQPKTSTNTKLDAVVKLDYRVLGKTGLKVTTVGFGCMITSDGTVIERAADMGVNYFDTARVYQSGNCERMVGAALKSRRKNIILSTKTLSRTKDQALGHLETSLKELQTDYIDIWYLHAKAKPEDVADDLLEAQRIAKQQGKIRFSGISTHAGHKELIPAVARIPHFDVLLTTYNFTMEPFMDELLATAAAAGLGIVAMKVMAGGQRPLPITPTTDKTKEILRRDGAMLAALKWSLKNKNVHTTIPSTTDVEQLEENVRAMAAPFSKSDETVLSARLRQIRPSYCSMCGSCEGTCAKGLPVADVLRYLMYAENYGQFSLGVEEYRNLPAELASVRCADCSKCTVQCVNGVQVVERLSRAQEWFA